MDQINLLKNIIEFYNKSRSRTIEGKDKKEILMREHVLFMKTRNCFVML